MRQRQRTDPYSRWLFPGGQHRLGRGARLRPVSGCPNAGVPGTVAGPGLFRQLRDAAPTPDWGHALAVHLMATPGPGYRPGSSRARANARSRHREGQTIFLPAKGACPMTKLANVLRRHLRRSLTADPGRFVGPECPQART